MLSVDEVARIILASHERRYRTFWLTTHSLGLRLGEALRLRIGDIDSARAQVHVRSGKGRKDRFVVLPALTLQCLRRYWRDHRHAYATHLIEVGLNLRGVQELLGHACPKTTTRYVHMTDKCRGDRRVLIDGLMGELHQRLRDMTQALAPLRLAEVFDAGHAALIARYGTRLHPRQRRKLLPVDYFMVTFTLPAPLRATAQTHPEALYAALFRAASQTLKGFAARKLNAELGQCAALHIHNRRLDLHPHVHVIVPGGTLDARRRQWRKLSGRYLFNAFALARVFRARLLQALQLAGAPIPVSLPSKWVVDCRRVGRGEPALQYLARYLYRGVIRERDLLDCDPHRHACR